MQEKGLNQSQVKERFEKYGENTLKSDKKIKPLKIFAGQFKDFMVMILLFSTILSVIMGETFEALTIIVIILLNATLGFIQEYKTERTLEALKDFSPQTTTVIRDGKISQIQSRFLVPDDIVMITSGDKIPADCVILSQNNLSCDESILTGESTAVEKNDNDNIFMGTVALRGKATAKVLKTGQNTQMGAIAGMLNEIEDEPTPLQKKLSHLGKIISIACIVICAVVMLCGILRGEDFLDMIITGISLAVAAVPEGLPAIVTICLALAVGRILKKKALIKRLHAVETLGCTNIICSDKTGTLTENKMTVEYVLTADEKIPLENEKFDFSKNLTAKFLTKIAVLCNNANVDGTIGEPTETSLVVMALRAGIDVHKIRKEINVIDEIPFDSNRKRMSVVTRENNGTYVYTKGAFDVILDKCSHYLSGQTIEKLTPQKRTELVNKASELANNAMRVLAFSYKITTSFDPKTAEEEMIFVGMTAIIDPPRKEAYKAVAKCRRAGIRPVMITGDYKDTAKAIAKDLKIYREGDKVLSGSELDTLNDKQLDLIIDKVSVFARVTPAHKLRIVRAFKKKGNIVAMTGDGVNDAPAIKEADIGVAMGQNGTDVTKEAADVILLDDNFATIVSAVEEGRVIYSNIRKFIRYLISCNIGEVITMFVGMLMGLPVVLTPIQILLINLVTDSLPALALGVDPPEKDIMSNRPRKKNDGVFSNNLGSKILFRGILIGLTTLAVFVGFYNQTQNLELSRTCALVTLIATQLIHVFECKSETLPIYRIPIFNNIKLVLAVLVSLSVVVLTLYFPPLQTIFETTALSLSQIFTILIATLVVPIISGIFTTFTKKPQANA